MCIFYLYILEEEIIGVITVDVITRLESMLIDVTSDDDVITVDIITRLSECVFNLVMTSTVMTSWSLVTLITHSLQSCYDINRDDVVVTSVINVTSDHDVITVDVITKLERMPD
jgi:hypothetical protein